MRNSSPLLITAIFLFTGQICAAQTSIQVSDPRLEVKDNIVHISYDILNSLISDKYVVTLEVLDSNDREIVAHAVSGDIGENVSGGVNKEIQWDLQADSIFMEADIFIKVRAKLIPHSDLATAKSFSRAGLIIQSVALPGLGLSRLTGNPHWIRGVVGYGCIAGSVVFNRKAIAAFDEYLTQETVEGAQDFYKTSTQYDRVSELLSYASIGIWVTDLIWTIIGTSHLDSKPLPGRAGGFSVTTGFEKVNQIPVVGLRYTF